MLCRLLCWTVLLSLVGQLAHAQDDSNAVIPPQLMAFVDAGFPDTARDAGVTSATVMLVITIDADGFVEDVTLAGEPVGYGFDEAARNAARRFVFEPARKDGQPMRARIQYRYDFELGEPPTGPPAAPPAQSAPPPLPAGSLEIRVLDAGNGKPISKAEIVISAAHGAGAPLQLETDARGRAGRSGLSPGHYQVRVSKSGLEDETHDEEIVAGEVTELTYRLSEHLSYAGYGAVARIKAPPREVTRRTIEREALTRIAGTRGDALRTIELLPGVARPPFGTGVVLIRGSSPQDSQILLDGVPVPLLYHFGGLTSFINSRALDRIDFYPGNFSVKYGRAMGGIVDVGTREPARDGYHGVVDMNVPLDSSLLVEGPLGSKASFMVAGRRSYFGEIATAVIPKGSVDAFPAPVYNDYQVFLNYRPTDRDRLRFSAYGSSDRLKVLFSDAPDDNPTIRGIELGQHFHRQQVGWSHRYSSRLDHNIEASFGRIYNDFKLGSDLFFNLLQNSSYVRGELRYRVTDSVQLTVGTDTLFGTYGVRYQGPPLGGSEGETEGGSLNERPSTRIDQAGFAYAPALYLELALQPIKKLRVIPGLRGDYTSRNHCFTFDPRLAAVYSLTETWRIKGGVGVFSQPPREPETAPGIGNPNLLSQRSIHYGAGVEHNFTSDLSLGVEGFYKDIYRRVVPTQEGVPPYTNDGIGRVYGLEVAGRKQASGRWLGFLSYTLMRAQRKDPNQPWRPFDFDQTHIFTLAGSVLLGHGWEAGATVRIVTGNPRTPYTSSAPYNLDSGNYFPEAGRINSARNPTFNRIDLRVEKKWTFDAWRLAWYLDIQNVYNSKNPENISYSFDYSQQAPLRGLPIIPIIGLRGEL